MKPNWRIWTLYALCLAVVLPAMVWLTHRALQLDAAEAAARARAEQEENLGIALWQIDSEMTRLVANEAARPHFVYQPFYSRSDPAAGKGSPAGETPSPSPLLATPTPFVLLHFELSASGQWSSPQCPGEPWIDAARAYGLNDDVRNSNSQRMHELLANVSFAALDARLPPLLATNSAIAAAEPPKFDGASPIVQNSIGWDQSQAPVQQEMLSQQANEAPGQTFTQGFEQERRSQSRIGYGLFNRDANFRAAAQQQARENMRNLGVSAWADAASVGVSQPVWVGGHLLLVRRVATGGETVIQGCWLDWPAIRRHIQQQVAGLAPGLVLKPVKSGVSPNAIQTGRLLATLPVQAAVPEPVVALAAFSPVRVSLMMAWACLTAVLACVGVLLLKVLALSERRAAFVSSVTHELRTPLTTFRLYSEMLASGMAQDEEQRQTYYETLRSEADRLYHLVENVLAYSRLERGRAGAARELVSAPDLVDRMVGRLTERAAHADMELIVEIDSLAKAASVRTDPAAVEQILFNLVDNSSKYAAHSSDKRIHLTASLDSAWLVLSVADHGPGLAAKDARRRKRPFSKSAQEAANSAPGVGLGLALCRRLAKALGGRLRVASDSTGARVSLELPAEES